MAACCSPGLALKPFFPTEMLILEVSLLPSLLHFPWQ